MIVVPFTGILSGYWMRKNRYGVLRSLIIAANIIVTAIILFTAVFISPEMKTAKQKKFENNRILEQNKPENASGQ
ncbi:MAG TPA: hypothetical protein DHV36_09795 [Desulfobacteraceae bacterium]|nr:hypothetical protein [Desulfobacteraceae bacterium]